MNHSHLPVPLFGAIASLLLASVGRAQTAVGTAFTYQGELAQAGVPANGTFDLRFRLMDASSTGNQVGAVLCVNDVAVADGRFVVNLDFGPQYGGQRRYLEVMVRPDSGADCSDATGFDTLTPRQELTITPFAASALTAQAAATAQNALAAQTAVTAQNALALNGQGPTYYTNAANLTGFLNDGRLSANVPLKNAASTTFTGAVSASSFTGSGTGLTGLNAANISSGTINAGRLPPGIAFTTAANAFGNFTNTFAGSVGIGTTTPGQKLSVAGMIESTMGGFKFPNGTSQDSASPWIGGVPASGTEVLDQTMASSAGYAAWNNQWQSFTPSVTGLLTAVTVLDIYPSGGTVSLTLEIRAGEGPSGTLLSSTPWSFNSGSVGAPRSILIPVGSAPFLTAGQQYTFRLYNVIGSAGALWGSASNVYSGGRSSDGPNWDLNFRTWMTVGQSFGYVSTQHSVGINTAFPTNALSVVGSADVSGSLTSNSLATGAITATSISANYLAGPGSGITDLNAGALAGTVPASALSGVDGSGLVNVAAANIAGVLGNWQTTAAAANTASALVVRDSSGNFSAGTITASLNGNATSATNATNATNAAHATDATQLNGHPGSYYTNAANIAGSGAAITDVNAAQLGGLNASAYARLDSDNYFGYYTNSFAGYVGINTSSPPPPLTMNAAGYGLYHTDGTISMGTYLGGGGGQLGTRTNHPLQFFANNGGPLMTILPSGNVGIGTTSPTNKLSISGNADISGNLAAGSGIAGYKLSVTGNTGAARVSAIFSDLVNSTLRIGHPSSAVVAIGGNVGHVLQLGGFANDSSTFTPYVTIATSGNFGINTTSPTQPFTCVGNGQVTGSFSKGSGTFKIDHPLDPENKFLYHSFVESPDMMNVYNGNIVTDDSGYATIDLPAYFEALNQDFRYQVSIIDDGEQLGDLVLARVVKRIENNRFTIKSSVPHIEVSWQVTGVRRDAFARKNRVVPEVEKTSAEKGKYLHPEAFDLPVERGIFAPTSASPLAGASGAR